VMEHFKIIIEENKLRIEGMTTTFPSIQSLLHYYEQNRIHPSLRFIGSPYTEYQYREYRRNRKCCNMQ
jgi:hypothetical protein